MYSKIEKKSQEHNRIWTTYPLARTERNDDDQQLALRDDVQRRDIDPTVGDEPQRDDVLGAQTTLVVGSEIVAGLGSARESDSGELPGPVIRELADVGSSGTHEPSSRGLFETAGFARRQPDRTTGQDVGQVANEGSVTPDFLALVATMQGAHEGGSGEAPPNPFWDQSVQDELRFNVYDREIYLQFLALKNTHWLLLQALQLATGP